MSEKVAMFRSIFLRSQAKDLLSLLQQQGKQRKEFSHLLLEMQKYATVEKPVLSTLREDTQIQENPLLTLHQLLKQKQYQQLDQYVHSLSNLTDPMRVLMIKSYYERNQPERIYMLYKEMKTRQKVAVRYYMESCIRTQRLGNALFALQSRRDIPLDWYSRLLDACLLARQWRLAYRVVGHVPHRVQDVYPHLVYHGYLQQAQDLTQYLESPFTTQVQRALLHTQVLKGFDVWVAYWDTHSHVQPWIKTLEQMILDCRARPDVPVQVEDIVPSEYLVPV
jgi:hypothetical protein